MKKCHQNSKKKNQVHEILNLFHTSSQKKYPSVPPLRDGSAIRDENCFILPLTRIFVSVTPLRDLLCVAAYLKIKKRKKSSQHNIFTLKM